MVIKDNNIKIKKQVTLLMIPASRGLYWIRTSDPYPPAGGSSVS